MFDQSSTLQPQEKCRLIPYAIYRNKINLWNREQMYGGDTNKTSTSMDHRSKLSPWTAVMVEENHRKPCYQTHKVISKTSTKNLKII